MAQEIERKFLVVGDFMPEVFRSYRISQGYLSSSPGRTVRVRVRDDQGFITIKGPSNDGGLSRFEWEKEIPAGEAEELLALAEPVVIDKTRHLIHNTDGTHIWEVDVFHGANEGLVLAEIELGAPDEPFDRPAWLGQEVTGDRRYYNSYLSHHPFTAG
ncbi:MAG: CYTH domain-containing protein [Bacteroidales bacterium]|jgi:CYTH domain-containing protein|nr:CYTH domain-containing protein [Bacteroidales bacterium]